MLGGQRSRKDGSMMVAARKYRLKIAAAIVIGIFFGAIFAFLHPNGLFSITRNIHIHPVSQQCIYTNEMKQQMLDCESELQDKIYYYDRLEAKLSFCEQVVFTTRTKIRQITTQQPFGCVKSLSKNPSVHPIDKVNPRLAKLLQTVAVDRELIVALADSNVRDLLEFWIDSLKKVFVTNYLVVAMDNATASFCQKKGAPVYVRDSYDEGMDNVGRTGGNREVPGLKYRILREFLQLGYSVLVSDVDVVYMRNPFEYLHRDCDIESMTDGHDNLTSYGFDEVYDEPGVGWARYTQTLRIWSYSSGFFYIRSTAPSIELMYRVANRLLREDEWDQKVFNQELFYPSYPGYEGLQASKRTMDIHLFPNSKLLFKVMRNDPRLVVIRPVAVHVNYHSNKLPRMQAILGYYDNRTWGWNEFNAYPDAQD